MSTLRWMLIYVAFGVLGGFIIPNECALHWELVALIPFWIAAVLTEESIKTYHDMRKDNVSS